MSTGKVWLVWLVGVVTFLAVYDSSIALAFTHHSELNKSILLERIPIAHFPPNIKPVSVVASSVTIQRCESPRYVNPLDTNFLLYSRRKVGVSIIKLTRWEFPPMWIMKNASINPIIELKGWCFPNVFYKQIYINSYFLAISEALTKKSTVFLNIHISPQLLRGSRFGSLNQLTSGSPQTLSVIGQRGCDANQNESPKRKPPFGLFPRFFIFLCLMISSFYFQFTAYGHIDGGRKVYGYILLLSGALLGLIGAFGLVGDWWNVLLS